MTHYVIGVMLKGATAPYLPVYYIMSMSLWRNNIAPTLTRCGFIHLGECMVLGNDTNLIEFKLTLSYDSASYEVSIKEFLLTGG
jgi:hypothetical protein